MCDVTKYNFSEIYPQIEESLRKAVFISVDCEFTALCVKNEYKGSLFDTPHERYSKMRKNLANSLPLEIGLTAFSFDRDEVTYRAKPYKFYLFPPHFGSFDKIFTCQSSGFHFLGEHKFDFNKVIYSGVPFLNRAEENEIREHVDNNNLYEYCKWALENKRSDMQTSISRVSEWFHSQKNKNETVLYDVTPSTNYAHIYLLHKDIRSIFPQQVWTFEENHQFKVRRVSTEEFKQLSSKSFLEQHLLTSVLGFTKVYRLLSTLNKPIVGHNFLNDLMLIINTFESHLPKSYPEFKRQVNELFPTIFDTKTLSFELLKCLPEESKWKSNGLQELYEYFKNEAGRHLVPGSPRIEIAEGFKTYKEDKFHDAGWDAYCTGYCFIRMAHFFAAKHFDEHSRKVFVSTEHLKAVKCFKNYVNIIRASIPYLNMSGADPTSQRPPCLIIQSTSNKPVDIFKVTTLLREYGSVDVRPHSCKGRRAIAAVANYGSARRILSRFHKQDDFKIVTYNAVKHSPVLRAFLWGGAIASGSILAWLLHSQVLKS